jgi:hypothetical protein
MLVNLPQVTMSNHVTCVTYNCSKVKTLQGDMHEMNDCTTYFARTVGYASKMLIKSNLRVHFIYILHV